MKLKRIARLILSVFFMMTVLLVAHAAFATPSTSAVPRPRPVSAPEIDPRLALEGLALAGGCAIIVWKRVRRKR